MYEVKLEAFEGPLDLLLHLIKKYEIDIYDISMKLLTDQYLHYINREEVLDINVHGDYLVMASELLRIKSRMLLPVQQEEEDDPREALVHQLIEYQNYKYYAALLEEKRTEKTQVFIKAPHDTSEFETQDVPLELSPLDLAAAYQRAKARRKLKKTEVVMTREQYSVQQATAHILSCLDGKSRILFEDLFDFTESRQKYVTIFMALLEMMKQQLIIAKQQQQFGEIEIMKAGTA